MAVTVSTKSVNDPGKLLPDKLVLWGKGMGLSGGWLECVTYDGLTSQQFPSVVYEYSSVDEKSTDKVATT